MTRSHLRLCVPLLLALGACKNADNLLYEPKAKDNLDGYDGSYAQAGVNTEMDWGPKQNYLLSDFKDLKEKHLGLQKVLQTLQAENQNLKTQLAGENGAHDKEKTLRVQAEAETRRLQQERTELQARILSLSIEKAKLEQMNLLAKIAEMQKSLEDTTPGPTEASAPAPGGHR